MITDEVKRDIATVDVVLYMKGQPGNSTCGCSNRLVDILNHMSISYVTHQHKKTRHEKDRHRRGYKAFQIPVHIHDRADRLGLGGDVRVLGVPPVLIGQAH